MEDEAGDRGASRRHSKAVGPRRGRGNHPADAQAVNGGSLRGPSVRGPPLTSRAQPRTHAGRVTRAGNGFFFCCLSSPFKSMRAGGGIEAERRALDRTVCTQMFAMEMEETERQ